jgi:hypothetical protein
MAGTFPVIFVSTDPFSTFPHTTINFMASRRQIVDSIAAVAQKLGRAPTQLEFAARSEISRHEVLRIFPKWNDAVREAGLRPHRQKVAAKVGEATSLPGRVTYGNPISFRGLRHEPVNEQGVVLLFGMLAEKLGYVIEAVQMGFPDCEAKRRISPQRWERVRIEFEFESRNFRDHGHPVAGCDVIVCWRHNWEECPPHLEIVELCHVVNSAASP